MYRILPASWLLSLFFLGIARSELQVGAAIEDVTPTQFPVLVNGGMLTRSTDTVNARIHARAIVVDDGRERIGIVVVDSCMLPRDLLDEAKRLAASRTGLKPDRILVSATHTHTAPSAMGALGTEPDETYIPLLRQKIADALVAAEKALQPAEVGWGAGDANQYTALRRWVRRPDRVEFDPFGNPTVRANMHAANKIENVIGPSGPEDPELSMISFRTRDSHRPIAVLSNFSMHYFSDKPISPDYFGRYCNGFQEFMQAEFGGKPDVVAVMSHGCSGDIWRRDYFPDPDRKDPTIEEYTAGLLGIAKTVYRSIQHDSTAELAMDEVRLPMRYRVPDAQRLEWAKRVVSEMGDRPAKVNTEVYAREQILLDRLQSTEVVVQALRIGNIGIATTPNETYALTGLKLKLQSPLAHTMVIELANGGDGYIPPPEQHLLGGYNTWAARTAGLEVTAEPRIVGAGLQLLERVSGKNKRAFQQATGPLATAILEAKPIAYWRMHEMAPPIAVDASGHGRNGTYEPGVLFFLEGDDFQSFSTPDQPNRAAHFAGGRLVSELANVGDRYSVALSCWNGMPTDGRPVTGWMFSRDVRDTTTSRGLHLGLGGVDNHAGRVILQTGDQTTLGGKTSFDRWSWNQVVLVRDRSAIQVYVNGRLEIETRIEEPTPDSMGTFFFGGRSDNQSNWEGRLDEVAVFDRPLAASEIERITVPRPRKSP